MNCDNSSLFIILFHLFGEPKDENELPSVWETDITITVKLLKSEAKDTFYNTIFLITSC